MPRPTGKNVDVRFEPAGSWKNRIVRALPELKLAFCNIVGNSIKYSGPEVRILISTRETIEKGRRCFVTAITDNGYGIPDDIKRTIFEINRHEITIPQGNGLGLYIAKVLTEALGGQVKLEDRVPGDYRKGTKVTIIFPAAEGY